MKKDKLMEEVWKDRREAINRTDEQILKEFKARMQKGKVKQRSRTPVIIALIFLGIASIVMLALLFNELTPDRVIEYRYTERIVQKEPVIHHEQTVNNITQYLQPENTANCIKVQIPGNPKYTMQCEEVN